MDYVVVPDCLAPVFTLHPAEEQCFATHLGLEARFLRKPRLLKAKQIVQPSPLPKTVSVANLTWTESTLIVARKVKQDTTEVSHREVALNDPVAGKELGYKHEVWSRA